MTASLKAFVREVHGPMPPYLDCILDYMEAAQRGKAQPLRVNSPGQRVRGLGVRAIIRDN